MTDIQDAKATGEAMTMHIGRGEGTGYNGGLTWTECQDTNRRLYDGHTKEGWYAVATYLAAQLAGSRRQNDADAALAMMKIESAVRQWREAQERAA